MRHPMAVLLIVLAGAAPAMAQREGPLDKGRRALLSGDPAGARLLFVRAERVARRAGDTRARADAVFFQGLALQREAEKEGADRTALLKEAIAAYQRRVQLAPSAAALNNMAQAQHALGDTAGAIATLRSAAASADAPAYVHMSLADLYKKQGEWKQCAASYRVALRAEPHNDVAEQWLFDWARREGNEAVLRHLWDLLQLQNTGRAQDRAVQLLEERWGAERERAEALAVVAVALSRQYQGPQAWMKSPLAGKLEALRADGAVGNGAAEIQLLYGGTLDPGAYSWWGARGSVSEDPPRGVWPRDAFRQLIRALGGWYRAQKEPKQAEAHYLLSTHLTREEPDPTALMEIADLYASTGRLPDLSSLIEREEPDLFQGKGMAYRSSQTATIYRYHRALGTIYSLLGRWSGGPASAEFQLQRAVETARDYNARPRAPERDAIRVEPRLYEMLATTYEKLGRKQDASRVRIGAARDYLSGDDVTGAAVMLQSAGGPPPEGLSASDRAAWLDVSGRLERAATAGTHAPAVDLQRVSVHDLALKGIVRTPQGYTALLLDPKGRTYFVSEGQKFLDGEMGKIEDGSINLRSAKDPKSPKRDVKVLLRPVKGRPDD